MSNTPYVSKSVKFNETLLAKIEKAATKSGMKFSDVIRHYVENGVKGKFTPLPEKPKAVKKAAPKKAAAKGALKVAAKKAVVAKVANPVA